MTSPAYESTGAENLPPQAGARTPGLAQVLAGEQLPDAGSPVSCPRPLDLHVHGGGGVAVGQPDAELAVVAAAHAPAAFLATLPIPGTAGTDTLLEQVADVAAQAAEEPACVGLRVEGLFINPEMAGIWPTEGFAEPDPTLLDELAAAAGGMLRVVDIAPELDGAVGLVEHARALGIVCAMAHTRASADEARRGFDAGITLATHTFNAMTGFHHRAPGAAIAALLDPRVTCELIADGAHLHTDTIRLAFAAAGHGRCALVSDASPLAGCAEGTSIRWGNDAIEIRTGACRTHTGQLAGSAATLMECLRVAPAQISPAAFVAAATATPWSVIDPDCSVEFALARQAVDITLPALA